MSLASLEREMAWHLRTICKNQKLRIKDISEWSSDEQTVRKNVRQDETVVFVPQLGLWCAVLSEAVKSPLAPCNQKKSRGGYAGVEQS